MVTKEPDDGRHVSNDRGECVAFPVRNRGSADTDLLSNLLLEEFQVQTAGSDVVAYELPPRFSPGKRERSRLSLAARWSRRRRGCANVESGFCFQHLHSPCEIPPESDIRASCEGAPGCNRAASFRWFPAHRPGSGTSARSGTPPGICRGTIRYSRSPWDGPG